MKIKLQLFFLFLNFVFLSAFSQSILPKYAIVANVNLEQVKHPGISALQPYNADSTYILIDHKMVYNNVIYSLIKPILPQQKINYQWQTSDSFQTIVVTCFSISELNQLVSSVQKNEIKGEWLYNKLPFTSTVLKINLEGISQLLVLDFIKFISFKPPINQEINFVGRTNHRVSQFAPNFPLSSTLTGKGIIMGEWDGGDVGNHIDFANRLTLVKKLGINSHATHVAGTMAGAGNLEPSARGMAPEATIYSWDFNGDIPLEMDTFKPRLDYVLTQNSYGYWTNNCMDFALYDQTSTEMDKLSIKFPDLLHVFAAGNSRGMNCVSGGFKTILPGFQSAKNTISVAAINSIDGDANFSCAGPTQDGRFKPEISAVGVNVYSTQNSNTYAGGWNGTSMATPGASGTIAVLYEQFYKKNNFKPLNYLGKNIISNSADDIGNVGPDYKYGFGRINARVAINLIDSGFWAIDSVSNGANYYDTIRIPANLNELRVMLTWNDKEINNTGGQILINDLDLTLIDSLGNPYNVWWCNPSSPNNLAIRKRDSINNIEQVTLKNPPSGRYIFRVNGKKIASGKQAFAVTYLKEPKALTITYPNGRETMESPSNNAKAQTIRWDSKGISGTYTLNFSRDSGTTWSTIASGIPNAQNYFTWQTLADTVNTGRALISITNGTVSDASDNVFSITGLVSGILTTVCDSQVFLRWNKATNTNFYRVYMLKNGKMTQMGTTKDTSFVITRLANNVAHWFAVSKRGLNGSESERTRAISVTPTSANFPPRISLQPLDIATCFTNNYFVKSKASGTNSIATKWEYTKNNGNSWTTIPNSNDSINLKTYLTDYSFKVRRTYSNVCLAPVYTRIANIQADSLLDVKFFNKDTTICMGSIYIDSLKVKSKLPATITWYNDSLTFAIQLQKGFSTFYSNTIKKPMAVWAKVENLCGNILSKDLSKTAKLNGRNDYSLFAKPSINIADTLLACIGENFTISPLLTGGKPGAQKLKIITDDSVFYKNSITIKITRNQTVKLQYFDNCFPDTTTKIVYIKMRNPLSVNLNNDSTICYSNKANLRATTTGGNGNYTFTWSDVGVSTKNRLLNLNTSQQFKVIVADNCTENTAADSILISVLPALSLSIISNKDTLCYGNTLNIIATAIGGRTNTHNITWQNNGLIGYTPSFTPIVSNWYKATLTDGCSPAKLDSIYVVIRQALAIKITKLDTLCNNKTVQLTATFTGGLTNAQTIEWQPINKIGTTVNYNPTITQNIIAKISDGCTVPNAYDTLKVNVYKALQLHTISDTQTCYGQALLLKIKTNGGKTNTLKTYWQGVKTNVLFADSFTTNQYTYTVADACKDSLLKTVKVTVTPKLVLSPSILQKCSYNNLPIVFTANTTLATAITWNTLPAGPSQTFTNKTTANYIATIADGCSDTTMQTIAVMVSNFTANNFNIDKVITKTATLTLAPIANYTSNINWGNANQSIENGPSALHTYEDYGIYTICRILQDNIACSDTICKTYNNADPAGFSSFNFKLFPNPVKDELNILLNQLAKNMRIEIIDAKGKLVYNSTQIYPAYKLISIDTKALASGMYTLRLNINGEWFTEKFLKVE